MPCHRNVEDYLAAYLDGASLRDDPKGPLFRTIGRGAAKLTRIPLPPALAERLCDNRPTREWHRPGLDEKGI